VNIERNWLLIILCLALLVRFIFFPDNVYFGYDLARDSYAALEILNGHLKIIGPPSSANDNLFHGPLIYYIYASIYFLSHNNPEAVSFIFRIINALGLLLVFSIVSILFNKRVGLIAAFIFALSYEQSQYSLFLSHPALAVLTVLIFYLGLALLLFKKKPGGLILSFLGIGLSIQFHYVNLFLFVGFFASLIFLQDIKLIFKFSITKFRLILLGLLFFILSISTFILAEYKFHFREIKALTELKSSFTFSTIKTISQRSIHDNLLSVDSLITLLIVILFFAAIKMLLDKPFRKQALFLTIWFFTGLIPYILSGTTSYYHNPAASVSLIIFVSFLISLILKRNMLIGLTLIAFIAFGNLNLILSQNIKGPNRDFVIEPGMLTKDEKKILDFCYQKAKDKKFSVSGLTIPLYINTTWSYLFEWYGSQKYGYLPLWGGRTASGYAGHLKVVDKRSDLPDNQCLIIEPTVGLSDSDKENFLREESYFSKVLEQKQFGTITVQYRRKF